MGGNSGGEKEEEGSLKKVDKNIHSNMGEQGFTEVH